MPLSLSMQARWEVIQHLAPRYQQASRAQKTHLLDECVSITGYARKYALRLLNYPAEARSQPQSACRYGDAVLHALLAAWTAANHICAERLIPFLPTLLEALERHGHLYLSQEHRDQLLTMSVSTADRFLRAQPKPQLRGLSCTKAGIPLKHQIPIRTFRDWDEAQPGFLEADLVAHGGMHIEGGYLYTLTLTDVATGWTECLPLLHRGACAVRAALQRAQTLFPFPIRGLDTDNGVEFINEEVARFCEEVHISFTRGRSKQKRDQCFVEQKNGAIVRHMVGYERFAGEAAYRQLTELYRAVRLYVNCFQPSMKRLRDPGEDQTERPRYDEAKTPLQRLLQSGVLSAEKQQELTEVMQALDPVRLIEQIKHLQQAILRHAVTFSALVQRTPPALVEVFSVEHCTTRSLPALKPIPPPVTTPQTSGQELSEQQADRTAPEQEWRRTRPDPFGDVWGHVIAWLRANPERSSTSIFQALQRLFPGRFQPSQIRTLQRGMRVIRARLLATFDDQWQEEIIHGRSFGESGSVEPMADRASSVASR
jgi:hypothetical protein